MTVRHTLLALVSLTLLASTAAADLVTEALRDFRPYQIVTDEVREEPHRYWWIKSPLRRAGGDFAPDRADRVDVRYSRWQVIEVGRSYDQGNVFNRILETWEADGYEEIFSCSGSGCGNSQHWANNVFGESILYGLDRHQNYSTGTVGDDIRTLYTVRRGSQLNYVYWLEAVRTDPADRLADNLQDGAAVLATSFPPMVWQDVLSNNPDWDLVLVGHDYESDFDTAIANGLNAAESVMSDWEELGIDADRVRLESVGYLAPSPGQDQRVTVILPPGFQ